jgi:MoaA/NifB/PqqE/SkfB family radical SAM enzyme
MLTQRCNYRCRGCTVWREQKNFGEISTDDIKAGLNILRKLGVIEIVFSGGNPLLRDDIGEILGYASRFFITTIYDNGSMALRKIDALRNADFVAISLDTLNPKKFDYIKGVPGAWKTAVEAIQTLHNENIQVGVSPTISQLNLYEILDFTKYFTERGVPVWYCLYGYDYPCENQLFKIGKKVDDFEIRDRKAMVEICANLATLKNKSKGVYITTKTLRALKNFFMTGQRTWRCRALESFFMIDPLGNVAGCHLNEPVTTVSELLDVWNSQYLEALRKKYRECNQCTYLCYIFYSLHADVLSNLSIVLDQWKNLCALLTLMHKKRR